MSILADILTAKYDLLIFKQVLQIKYFSEELLKRSTRDIINHMKSEMSIGSWNNLECFLCQHFSRSSW